MHKHGGGRYSGNAAPREYLEMPSEKHCCASDVCCTKPFASGDISEQSTAARLIITVYCKSLKSLHNINGKVTLLKHLLDEIQNKDNSLILYGIIWKTRNEKKRIDLKLRGFVF